MDNPDATMVTILSERCLTSREHYFSHIMTRSSYISMRWCWCLLCTRPTRL